MRLLLIITRYLVLSYTLLSISTGCTKNSEVLPPNGAGTPAPNPSTISKPSLNNEDFNSRILASLQRNEASPFFILVYSKPGNPDLAVMREYIHKIDANLSVDQDLLREREFTDYPFTVDSYIVSIQNMDKLQQLKDAAYRYSATHMILIPIQKIWLRTYFQLKYTKRFFNSTTVKTFWIGDTSSLDGSKITPTLNLEDPATYAQFFDNCRFLTSSCLETLLNHGYFQRRTVIDGNYQLPIDFLLPQLKESIDLRSQGFSGKKSIFKNGLSNIFGDKIAIESMSLVNEVWVNGMALTQDSPKDVLLLSGPENRAIANIDSSGRYSFLLPVGVASSNVTDNVEEDDQSLLLLLKNFQDLLNNQVAKTEMNHP